MTYSTRARRPSLWEQLTRPGVPAGLLARLIGGFLLGVALMLLLLLAGAVVLILWALISVAPWLGAIGIAGVFCLACAVIAALS